MEEEGKSTLSLRNKYWILRHGKSVPNVKGLIVSSLENGVLPEYRLAPDGVNQAGLAAELFQKELKANAVDLKDVQICYSPFSRTTHTAEVVATKLSIPFDGPQCKMVEDLRERFFGPTFELLSHDKYSEIWELDERDPFRPPEGGESVNDVASRLARVIVMIESEFKGCHILVISHGDPLQILQAIIKAVSQQGDNCSSDLASRLQAAAQDKPMLSQHRKYALLTGELRALI